VLRERLIGDLAAMQALVLAWNWPSAESAEQRAALDLDSLLESIVEDTAEGGADVVFEGGTGAVLMLRPLAMHRLFSNLVDNAVMYAQRVRVRVERSGGAITDGGR
jgi:signal transduction histidine kinase